MIVTAPTHTEPEFFDGDDYALMITVNHDGLVEIQHQAESDRVADRRMARLAAEIIDQVGPGPVVQQLGAADVTPSALYPAAIDPPPPGRAVMACRCGQVMDARDMRRLVPPRSTAHTSTVIHRIVCWRCAA